MAPEIFGSHVSRKGDCYQKRTFSQIFLLFKISMVLNLINLISPGLHPLVEIFPEKPKVSDNDTLGRRKRKKRAISSFAKSIKKDLKMTFNDTLPDCAQPTLP